MKNLNPRIIIKTYGSLKLLLKALDCLTLSAKAEIMIPLCDIEEMLSHFSCDEDGDVITNFLHEGTERIEVNESDLNMDKLNKSHLTWYYEDEEDENDQ